MITGRALNRTLLQRQHLLERAQTSVLDMTEQLLGLQAQEPLPPYLSLHSRIADFDPVELSELLAQRKAVRILLMRGTIHLVSPEDALELRPLVQPMLDKITKNSQVSRDAADIPRTDLAKAGRAALQDGPLSLADLAARLSESFPDHPAKAVANSVREMLPLVQVPPRGLWKRSGGVVYETAESWLGRPLSDRPDLAQVVRRYLRAFGPATAADITTWSGITGIRQVLAAMADELVVRQDENGRRLFDVEGLPIVEPDAPAPVRLLGKYDNLWLSHAERDRVTEPAKRKRWMGLNGGMANTVFVDGYLEGLWREVDGRVEVSEPFRSLTRSEQQELDAEVEGVQQLLAR